MEEKQIRFISIGADPEVFISLDNKIVPCIGVIGGKKKDPLVITEMMSVLEDNVCLEWNMSPSYSKKEFVNKCAEALSLVKNTVLPDGYEVVIKDFHEFNPEELTYKAAKEFGCEADYNAYTLRINESPDPDTNFRAAGGHLHFGVENISSMEIVEAVRLCDAIIGTHCVMNEEKTIRRKIYGGAGSFRVKDYGFEYRTPSNFWIESDDKVAKIYDLAETVFSLLANGSFVKECDLSMIQTCINSHDIYEAKIYHERYMINEKNTIIAD
jgi:hypothetical protein